MPEIESIGIEQATEEVASNEGTEREPLDTTDTPRFDPYFPQVRPRPEQRVHSPFQIYDSDEGA